MDNRTGVTILQHFQESRHPLGTVRLARLGLRDVDIHVAWPDAARSLHRPLGLREGTGLLYPSASSVELGAIAPSARPERLLILDGSWWQARRMFRDNPWLQSVPHYRLSPSSPSQYRVRREPAEHCLSTIESIVAALKELEPDTAGLDDLLQSFVDMIDRHIERRPPGSETARRRRERQCATRAVPRALSQDGDHLVLIYAETAHRRQHPRRGRDRAELLQWVALRPSTGEVFEAFLESRRPVDLAHVRHLQLCEADLAPRISVPEFLERWHAFLTPGSRPAAWNPSTSRLFEVTTGVRQDSLTLKHAYCNLRDGHCGTLDEVAEREGLAAGAVPVRGRAALRLGRAQAVLRFVQRLAVDPAPYQPSPPKRRRHPIATPPLNEVQ